MPRITIPISGIIANFEFEEESNVTPTTLRESLNKAGSEDILITINSPGGSVFAGLEMFSLIQNYPGNVETRIVSLAASMGSVLALAGNKKSAENTALYFIHNAQGIGIGDYRDLASESEWLKDISNLIANLYAEFTSLSLEDAQDFMDDDSHFIGSDLELLGFETVQTGNQPNAAIARVTAKRRFEDVKNKITSEQYTDDLEKAVASIDYKKFGIKNETQIEKGTGISAEGTAEARSPLKEIASGLEALSQAGINANTPASAGENNREVIMTLSEFLKENSTANAEYNQRIAGAIKAGEDAVKARIKTASAYFGSEYSDKIKDIAAEVITGEKSIETLEAVVAVVDMNAESAASAAAQVETGEQGDINTDTGGKNAESEAEYQAKKKRIGGQ